MRPCSATDIRMDLTEIGNQSKLLMYFEKKGIFLANLEHMLMFKLTTTDLDTEPVTIQQRLVCALKNSRLLPDGCCCLSDTGN